MCKPDTEQHRRPPAQELLQVTPSHFLPLCKGDWPLNAGYMLGTKSVWLICAVTEAAGSFLVFVVSLLSGEDNLWPTGPRVFLVVFF